MALAKVVVTADVVHHCLVHAYTTEREEVMGVLLGELVPLAEYTATEPGDDVRPTGQPDDQVARVWHSLVVRRNVRADDRVEIAPEALFSATEAAEELGRELGRRTRVIGWYHSHPRITAYPSQVDLLCQAAYQQMERGWVGLIFSVFHADSADLNSCVIHCFRAGDGGRVHEKIPLEIVPVDRMPLQRLPPVSSIYAMLRTFKEEIDEAVGDVEARCHGDAVVRSVARALGSVQLYTMDKLLIQPMLKHLRWSAIPQLEAEVEALERQLAASRAP